jgi:hypothetical protein
MVSFLINGVLAVMLLVATYFLVTVNKRLKVLRSGQEELNGLMSAFSNTIDETDASTKRLVAAATEISVKLAGELDRAKTVTEDVGVLLDSASRATRQLEESMQMARALARRLDEPPRPRPSAAPVSEPATAPPPTGSGGSTLGERLAALVGGSLIDDVEETEEDDDGVVVSVEGGAFHPFTPSAAEPEPVEAASHAPAGAFYRQLRTLDTGR